jgi:Domain of unknown function (DUF4260)
MKTLLKLEDLAEFLFGIFFFGLLSYEWWWFPALLLVPDLSMMGYLINPKIGAWLYNLVHHKGLAILCIIFGYVLGKNEISLAGSILLSHSAMDRMFGYGLKYQTAFKDTHLGTIGKNNK